MEISLAMGGRSFGRRSVRCVGCAQRFPAGLAGPGDDVDCPHCGDRVVIGGRSARVARSRPGLRVPRSGREVRVREPLRIVWRCGALACIACAAYVLLRDPAKTVATFEWLSAELRVQLEAWW